MYVRNNLILTMNRRLPESKHASGPTHHHHHHHHHHAPGLWSSTSVERSRSSQARRPTATSTTTKAAVGAAGKALPVAPRGRSKKTRQGRGSENAGEGALQQSMMKKGAVHMRTPTAAATEGGRGAGGGTRVSWRPSCERRASGS